MKPTVRTLKPGVILFHEKDHSRELYVLQSGTVSVFRTVSGREIPLATLKPGAVLGEMALIDGKPRSASARAVGACTVLQIDADTLETRARGVPSWFMSIIRTTSRKIRGANDRLQRVHGSASGANIILALQYLIHSRDASGTGLNEVELDFVKARSDLIHLLGVTFDRAQKALEFLACHGFVTTAGGTLRLIDPGRFEEYCRFLRLHLRKGFEKIVQPDVDVAAFIISLVRSMPEITSPSAATLEVEGGAVWKAVLDAGVSGRHEQVIEEIRERSLGTWRKRPQPTTDSPLAGAVLAVGCGEWAKYFLLSAYGALVPSF